MVYTRCWKELIAGHEEGSHEIPFLELMLWLLASPLFLVKGVLALVRKVDFYRTGYQVAIRCRNCGSAISLVGLWRCSCGFTYRGHLLRTCPVCEALPRMVRCYACGVTERLPDP